MLLQRALRHGTFMGRHFLGIPRVLAPNSLKENGRLNEHVLRRFATDGVYCMMQLKEFIEVRLSQTRVLRGFLANSRAVELDNNWGTPQAWIYEAGSPEGTKSGSEVGA